MNFVTCMKELLESLVRFHQEIKEVAEEDGRYPPKAYSVLLYAISLNTKDPTRPCSEDIVEKLEEVLYLTYGMLAGHVLKGWGIKGSDDFLKMLKVLVNNEVVEKKTIKYSDFEDELDVTVFERMGVQDVPTEPPAPPWMS